MTKDLSFFALVASFLSLIAFGCGSDTETAVSAEPEMVIRDSVVCYSLLGTPLKYPPETVESFRKKDSMRQVALENYQNDPGSLENLIWYGRRLGYLTEFREAMTVYTRGLHIHPSSPEIYRHRGHRYISMRRFEEAVNDLALASELARGREVEIEPDGIPNRLNTPLSSLQFNIWYHFGLAHYLQGNYDDAVRAYDSCMVYSTNPDLLVATSYWYYLNETRRGEVAHAEELLAGIDTGLEMVENDAYYKLLLMFKGDLPQSEVMDISSLSDQGGLYDVTRAYGVANYFAQNDQPELARQTMEAILRTPGWPSFGYIAAEADLARGTIR